MGSSPLFSPPRIKACCLHPSDCAPGPLLHPSSTILRVTNTRGPIRSRSCLLHLVNPVSRHYRSSYCILPSSAASQRTWGFSPLMQESVSSRLGRHTIGGSCTEPLKAGVRVFSISLASSSRSTASKPPVQNLSMTFGVLRQPSESRQAVLDYLRGEGIDTEELEDVELPTAVEVIQERITFLTKIGISKDAINNYPLMVTCSIKKNLVPVLDYLEQLGVSPKELPHLLEKYPMVLQSSVVIDLMPVIDFLLGLDIQRKDIAHVLLRFPDVLGFRLEGTISTSVAYLVSIGVRMRCIGAMLTAQPGILGMRVANTIKPKVDFLLSLGMPRSIVAHLLEMHPELLGFSLDDAMQPAVHGLLQAGVKPEALSKIVTQFPDILAQNLDENLSRKRNWLVKSVKVHSDNVPRILEKLPQVLFINEALAMERVHYLIDAGCSADDVAKMVTECPQLLALSIKHAIEPSLMFLLNEMRRPIKEVVEFPFYFTYNFEKRIKTRYQLIAEKGIECSLEWFLNCSSEKFQKRLNTDYIDDEVPGPLFQMGGPLPMNVNEYENTLPHARASQEEELDSESEAESDALVTSLQEDQYEDESDELETYAEKSSEEEYGDDFEDDDDDVDEVEDVGNSGDCKEDLRGWKTSKVQRFK